MESSPHCNGSKAGTHRRRVLLVLALLPVVLLVHGFHPLAEDGGLYLAGVEYKLQPQLFPHETAFVTEHLRFSLFAPSIAALAHLTHLSLPSILFFLYVSSAALTLFAASRIVDQCIPSPAARPWSLALFAAWWTIPVAGTSLLLMDPYVTARSVSTPFGLLAVAAALRHMKHRSTVRENTPHRRWSWGPAAQGAACLLSAAAFHPLMAGYALGLVVAVRLSARRSSKWSWCIGMGAVFLFAGVLQALAPPEGAAEILAVHSRYYWFLAQWHPYEWAGLLGPVLVFGIPLLPSRRSLLTEAGRALCRGAILVAVFATALTIMFAQEHFQAHPVARLQPLRSFLLLYALMPLLVGGVLAELARGSAARCTNRLPSLLLAASPAVWVLVSVLVFFSVARASFPASPQIELPGSSTANPWVQAFQWAREHTPPDALFALDARYISGKSEDAQSFRAIAERSAIPDFSKDGGEAAIAPALAPEWQRAAAATEHLSQLSDQERDGLLRPFGATWIVLRTEARTAHTCPYRNAVVKVCRLP